MWRFCFPDDSGSWPLVDKLLSEADKFSSNQCFESQISNATPQDHSQAEIKVYNLMFPYSFSKEIFKNLNVKPNFQTFIFLAL